MPVDLVCPKKLQARIKKALDEKSERSKKILNYLAPDPTKPVRAISDEETAALRNYSNTGTKIRPKKPTQRDRVKALQARIKELKTAKQHNHHIQFKVARLAEYKPGELKESGKFWKFWLLNAKMINGNAWGVSPTTIRQNIAKFKDKPFVITDKSWIEDSAYLTYEHPYLPTNHLPTIFNHQAKYRVGDIIDVFEENGDFYAMVKPLPKFAQRSPPPFCSPAIFQLDPREPENNISQWEALHLAGLDRDPAYGPAIAMLKGTCIGTSHECKIQFHGAKQLTALKPNVKPKLDMDSFEKIESGNLSGSLLTEEGDLLKSKFKDETHYDIARRHGYERTLTRPNGEMMKDVDDSDIHKFLTDTKTIRVQHFPQINKVGLHIPQQLTKSQIDAIRKLAQDPNLEVGYAIGRNFNDMKYGDGVRNLLFENARMFGQKQGGITPTQPIFN